MDWEIYKMFHFYYDEEVGRDTPRASHNYLQIAHSFDLF